MLKNEEKSMFLDVDEAPDLSKCVCVCVCMWVSVACEVTSEIQFVSLWQGLGPTKALLPGYSATLMVRSGLLSFHSVIRFL